MFNIADNTVSVAMLHVPRLTPHPPPSLISPPLPPPLLSPFQILMMKDTLIDNLQEEMYMCIETLMVEMVDTPYVVEVSVF